VLAVVAAFFGGLALGALTLSSRIEKSRRPVGWYAGCELIILLWNLVLIFAMPPSSAWLLRLTGVEPAPAWQWSVAFFGTLSFNVGVEIGQLLMVLAAYLVLRAPLPERWLGVARRPALYAIGVLAAYWSWVRIAAIAF